jgi:aquaporin Z
LIEAAGLALFMISAGAFATLLEYPQSPVRGMLSDPLVRRALMGIAMGATAIGLIYSPWGRQSGAHFNPAVTLAFSRLGKVALWDGVFYVIAQFVGGLAGVLAISAVLGNAFRRPPVEFVVTVPGSRGPLIAFLAEFAISCGLMLAVLYTSNRVRLMRYTGLFAGALLAGYITLEAPFSGTSMNPARIRRIFEEYVAGRTSRDIARDLSQDGVHRHADGTAPLRACARPVTRRPGCSCDQMSSRPATPCIRVRPVVGPPWGPGTYPRHDR